VVTECVSGLFVGPLLLWMTRAWQTADWRIVLALALFTSLGAPAGERTAPPPAAGQPPKRSHTLAPPTSASSSIAGAFLLRYMHARVVEGVMAAVLLAIIALHVDLPAKLRGAPGAKLRSSEPGRWVAGGTRSHASMPWQSRIPDAASPMLAC
jgi:uncharacterized membrane protein YfcA